MLFNRFNSFWMVCFRYTCTSSSIFFHVFTVVLCLSPTNMAPILLQKVGLLNNRLLGPLIFEISGANIVVGSDQLVSTASCLHPPIQDSHGKLWEAQGKKLAIML